MKWYRALVMALVLAPAALVGPMAETAQCSGGECEITVYAVAARGYSPPVSDDEISIMTQEASNSALEFLGDKSCNDACAEAGCFGTDWDTPSDQRIDDVRDDMTSSTPYERVIVVRAAGTCLCEGENGEMSKGVKAVATPVPSALAPIKSFFKRLFGKRIGG